MKDWRSEGTCGLVERRPMGSVERCGAGSAFSCALKPSTFVAFLEKLMSQDFIWCELQTKWQVMWRCILSVWGPSLTLLGLAGGREGGGIYAPPPHTCNYTNLTFPNYKFGKGQYVFYPVMLSIFAGKKWSLSEIPKLQTGSNASRPIKIFKSQTLFWKILGLHTSGILWNTSYFQKEFEP